MTQPTDNTKYAPSPTSPAQDYANVTKSHTVDLVPMARAVRFDESGAVSVVTQKGVAVTFTVIAGEIFVGNVRRINSTGTDGTSFIAFYK